MPAGPPLPGPPNRLCVPLSPEAGRWGRAGQSEAAAQTPPGAGLGRIQNLVDELDGIPDDVHDQRDQLPLGKGLPLDYVTGHLEPLKVAGEGLLAVPRILVFEVVGVVGHLEGHRDERDERAERRTGPGGTVVGPEDSLQFVGDAARLPHRKAVLHVVLFEVQNLLSLRGRAPKGRRPVLLLKPKVDVGLALVFEQGQPADLGKNAAGIGHAGLLEADLLRQLAGHVGRQHTGFHDVLLDLLPFRLLGTQIYNQKTGAFSIKKGPIFTNVILADEINRSPAKVQSALLESMQERQVTIGEETFPLDDLFLVLATQNPIEQEGTYPLPEAQVDRFMLKIDVTYPTGDEELEIMRRMARTDESASVDAVASPGQILQARTVINDLYIDERVEQYIVNLVLASRDPGAYGLGELEPLLEYGASPRASINLNLAARAHAFLRHRAYVTPEDVRAVAQDVMQHRLVITYEAEAEQVAAADLVDRILSSVEVP